VDPRTQVGSYVTAAEDYWEGFSIFDEFVPDQLGAVLRPTCTIAGDGLQALAAAYIQIRSGLFDTVAVEAHSKASDLVSYSGVLAHALDPIFTRPLGYHPFLLAGLDMRAFLKRTGMRDEAAAEVVAANRRGARENPRAPYGEPDDPLKVLGSKPLFEPLRQDMVAPLADGSVVLVLASLQAARELSDRPVWIRGIAWSSDTPCVEAQEPGVAHFVHRSARKAYQMAGIRPQDVDLAEVNDLFAHRQLLHVEALGLAPTRRLAWMVRHGAFGRDGEVPVNPSGGALANGNLLTATGLMGTAEVALQLQGRAGDHQVDGARVGVVQAWRGIPTATGGVAVLGVE
jgi:acetyl-CoA C-acetyltransferase